VANQVKNHGTHVSGTAVGDGNLSTGQYEGAAPGASFYFYKIGNDTDGNASGSDIIEAIDRAASVGCDIFSMSYGGYTPFLDGSNAMDQAVDDAASDGMLVFIAAGNEADKGSHFSVTVAPNSTSATFVFTIDNTNSPNWAGVENIYVIWIDNETFDENLSLSCSNLGTNESLTRVGSSISDRGTEGRQYELDPSIPPGGTGTYNLTLTNSATSGNTPLVHCYALGPRGEFNNPDPSYTVGSPAVADEAIAVGAWTQRVEWVDFLGRDQNDPDNAVGTLSDFSSRGPRVDGEMKPDIVAPGCWTISLLDNGNATLRWPVPNDEIIDNDGVIGAGPANYAISSGTSMACPLVAGLAACLLEEDSSLTPDDILHALTSTASMAYSPNDNVGFGLVNALDAYKRIQQGVIWVDFDHPGFEFGTYEYPYNTLAEALAELPGDPDDRIRFKPGISSETPTITAPVAMDAFRGTATLGE
jgi:subtilisin family serine protease